MDENASAPIDSNDAPAPAAESAPEPLPPAEARHVARIERSAARLAVAQDYAAAQAEKDAGRELLKGARVVYTPRRGEPGFGGRGGVTGVVSVAHNHEAADLVLDDGYAVVSAILAGRRDKAPGTPGTFEVL